MKYLSLLAVLMGLGLGLVMTASVHATGPVPLLSCLVPHGAEKVGYTQIEVHSSDRRGFLMTVATPFKGAIEYGVAKQADLEQGNIALVQNNSRHPFVYQSFLVKSASGWTVQKYWLCDFTYFEETCWGGDAMVLQAIAPASCTESN
jgi:hypothetical protein